MRKLQLSEDVFDIEYDIFEKNHYCDYDDSQYYFGEIDNQDGRYYGKFRTRETSTPIFCGYYDDSLETKKSHAVLYLHLHQELMSNPIYKSAYDMLRDESLRTCIYWMEHCAIIGSITEEDRAPENFVLDIQLLEYGKEKVNTYKDDASYIVNGISEGC